MSKLFNTKKSKGGLTERFFGLKMWNEYQAQKKAKARKEQKR